MKNEKLVRLVVRKILSENASEGAPDLVQILNGLLSKISSADENSNTQPLLNIKYGQEESPALALSVGDSRFSAAETTFSFDIIMKFSSLGYGVKFAGNGVVGLEREEDEGSVSKKLKDFNIGYIRLEGQNGEQLEATPETVEQAVFQNASKYIQAIVEQNIAYNG